MASKDMRVLIILTVISFQSFGQTLESLTKNDWIARQLDIPDIKTSDGEIDLRIFLDRGITNGGHAIRILKSNNHWTGTMYDYWIEPNKGFATDKINKVTKTDLKSKNWDSLWTKLEQLDITTLPNQNDIKDKLRKEVVTKREKGYEVTIVTDGSSYDLIISKNQIVRGYSFSNPWTYSENYPEVAEVRNYADIIETLEKAFQIKFRQ